MLSLYLTAGFPEKDLTPQIVYACAQAGVDFIELGMPFSDPIADGPTIQQATHRALEQGVDLKTVFAMVREIRAKSEIPIILMGYLNPVFQFGFKDFFKTCSQLGVDGLILPDWPVEESEPYLTLLENYDLDLIHLIAPNTPWARIKKIDRLSKAFVYCTAYTGVTGRDNRPLPETEAFLKQLRSTLNNPFMIGFGIKSARDFQFYCQYAAGVIVGSAFIKFVEHLSKKDVNEQVKRFVRQIKGKS